MFKLQLGFDYVCHWLSANSRHGVHSPFVYRLVDEVIYNSRAQNLNSYAFVKSRKVNALIIRLTDLFQAEKVIDYTNFDDFIGSGDSANFVIIRSGAYQWDEFKHLLDNVHPDTVLIIEGIYLTKEMKMAWQEIKTLQQISVSIDLFDVGLIFFRKGQAKEDFKIRF